MNCTDLPAFSWWCHCGPSNTKNIWDSKGVTYEGIKGRVHSFLTTITYILSTLRSHWMDGAFYTSGYILWQELFILDLLFKEILDPKQCCRMRFYNHLIWPMLYIFAMKIFPYIFPLGLNDIRFLHEYVNTEYYIVFISQ